MSWVQRSSIQPPPWLPSNHLALGTVAQAACSLACPTPSLGIPREAARGAGAWATKQPPEYFAHVFLLQLESHRSVTKPGCLSCHGLQRSQSPTDSERVCVCVCRGRRGVPFACACICLHSRDPECCLGWRSLWIILVTRAASSTPDTGQEAPAVTFSPDLSLGAPFLVPVERGGRTLAGVLLSASPDSS